jgi:transposase
MRYAQRGGYTPAERQRRERLRIEAAGRFARGDEISEIARDLRVTEGSVRRWHQAWRDGGSEALRDQGPVSRERLSPQQWARLEAELRKGPLAHGFANDQRWTLGRIKTLIGKLFHVGYTIEGTSKLMRRHGWSAQVPVRQALDLDDDAGAVWKDQVWPDIKHGARPGRLHLLRRRGRAGAEAARRPHLGAARRGPSCGCAASAAAGSASPGWRATGPATGRPVLPTCGCTSAARASRRASPGAITGT